MYKKIFLFLILFPASINIFAGNNYQLQSIFSNKPNITKNSQGVEIITNRQNIPIENNIQTNEKKLNEASINNKQKKANTHLKVESSKFAAYANKKNIIKILELELEKEINELVEKEKLLNIPKGRDAMLDKIYERIKDEVSRHRENITSINREITLISKK